MNMPRHAVMPPPSSPTLLVGKTKIMKCRRGGHLAKSDVITCNSNPIEFVSKIHISGCGFPNQGHTNRPL